MKTSTVPSRPIASSRGMLPGIDRPRRPAARPARSSSPATPPSRPSSTLSVSSWRTSRCQLAPSAVRTAISFCRPVARVSSRLATFAHAISSTSVTEPSTHEHRQSHVADDGLDERHDVDRERAVAFVLVADPRRDRRPRRPSPAPSSRPASAAPSGCSSRRRAE